MHFSVDFIQSMYSQLLVNIILHPDLPDAK